MSYIDAIKILDGLNEEIKEATTTITQYSHSKNYSQALSEIERINTAIDTKLRAAEIEINMLGEPVGFDTLVSDASSPTTYKRKKDEIREQKTTLDCQRTLLQEQSAQQMSQRDFQRRWQQIDERNKLAAVSSKFERSYQNLLELFKQPHDNDVDVKAHLSSLLEKVRRYHGNNTVDVKTLTKIMDTTYDRLTGDVGKNTFNDYACKLKNSHSVPLKILGGCLLALSIALVVSSVIFAPAVITAATTTLGAVWAYSMLTSTAGVGLSVGASSCFFKKTKLMELADNAKDINQSFDGVPFAKR